MADEETPTGFAAVDAAAQRPHDDGAPDPQAHEDHDTAETASHDGAPPVEVLEAPPPATPDPAIIARASAISALLNARNKAYEAKRRLMMDELADALTDTIDAVLAMLG